jgi:hypothetical protein
MVSFLNKKELNQSVEYSMKRNWMRLYLGLNIPLEYPLDAIHRRPELTLQSRAFNNPPTT